MFFDVFDLKMNMYVVLTALKFISEDAISIDSGDGLVPDGTKPLPESVLIKLHETMRRQGSMS